MVAKPSPLRRGKTGVNELDSSRRSRTTPTIKDVARTAGVSTTTVSNALNGRLQMMASETFERIQSVIRELSYHPNSVARGLVTHRTATIGLILAEIETPLFLQAVPPLEAAARSVGYNVLLCVARCATDEQEAISVLLEKDVEGIIFFSSSEYRDDSHLAELRTRGLPTVLVNRASQHAAFSQVNWDQTEAVASAVGWLTELGHQRIAILTGPESRRSTVERLDGYRQGLARCGIPFAQEYVRPGDFTAEAAGWEESTVSLLRLSKRPTAVVASDDIVAAVVLNTVQNAGLSVPQDISVLGIDDQPFSEYLNPGLTTIRLPTTAAGQRAAEMALGWITGRSTQVEHLVLPCPLIVRRSCGPAPGLRADTGTRDHVGPTARVDESGFDVPSAAARKSEARTTDANSAREGNSPSPHYSQRRGT
jgi:LacI family transcriptional regulator